DRFRRMDEAALLPPPHDDDRGGRTNPDESKPTQLEMIDWMNGLLAIESPWPPPKKRKKPTPEEGAAQRRFDLEVKEAILDTLVRAGDIAFDKETRRRIRERLGLNERQLGIAITKYRKEIEVEKGKAKAEAAVSAHFRPERAWGTEADGYFAQEGMLWR